MTNEKYDKLMLEALRLFKEQQLKDIPPENEIDYEFSERFKKKAEKLIQKQNKPVWRFFQSTGRKAAAIILAIIIGLSATLSIDAVREPIFKFFYSIFSTHTEIEYDQNSDKIITEYYTLSSVPYGYTLSPDTFINEQIVYASWTAKTGSQIKLRQFADNTANSIDSEDSEIKESSVNGIHTLFCDNNHSYICSWSEHGYYFELIYPSQLGKEYMYEVIGKLIEVENLNSFETESSAIDE